MKKTKKQHYLPQFYLKNFADNFGRICVVDANLDVPLINSRVQDVAQGRLYYDFYGDGDKQSLEKMFGIIESELSVEFGNLLQCASEGVALSLENKRAVVRFLKLQFLRSDWMRDKIPQEFINEYFKPEYVDKADKLIHAYIISESMFTEMLDYLYDYDMEVLDVNGSLEIFTSSFPLFFNYTDDLQTLLVRLANGNAENFPSLHSNLFFPLSSRYAIHIFDPQKPKGFEENEWISSFITSGISWANGRIYFRPHPNSLEVYPVLKPVLKLRSV